MKDLYVGKPHCRIPGVPAICLLTLLLAACGGGQVASTPRPTGRSTAMPSVRQPARTTLHDPQFQAAPGLQGVIGATQNQLVREFGQPRLDVWEGDARKLQFIGTACVLDVYLYPTSSSHEPLATYADARRSSDGQDVDRAACVAALRQK